MHCNFTAYSQQKLNEHVTPSRNVWESRNKIQSWYKYYISCEEATCCMWNAHLVTQLSGRGLCWVTREEQGHVGQEQTVWHCPKILIKEVTKSLMATRLNMLCSVFLDNCFIGRVELFELGALRINYFNKNSIKTTESYLLRVRRIWVDEWIHAI